ncbi:MAG TPA: Y-family DNA polymerase [Candidatus Binatia bacterium]|nr:Y-family DNA polymerase [Candidatus Binatia bacterium]
MKTVFALVDANNFFVSCERLFRPDLAGKPVIVRSSNDGCVVARSNEAKALGIPMGVPVFKIRQLLDDHHVVEFSGNFELYGDISRRLSESLSRLCPKLEVYSVDESFLDLSELEIKDYETWGRQAHQIVWHKVGLPVSIGIAPTKTLAKIASHLAKHDPDSHGVVDLMSKSEVEIDRLLLNLPLKEVWGIGWRLAPRLRAEGLVNAYQVKSLSAERASSLMGLPGRQLVAELNGISCHGLEPALKPRQSLARTRMFGADSRELPVLEAALASLTASACTELRQQHLLAGQGSLFLTTNKHKPGYRRWSREIKLSPPTADTGKIISMFTDALAEIFNPAANYHRAGVLLQDLTSDSRLQTDLLGEVDVTIHELAKDRLKAVDKINKLWGKSTIHYATESLSQAWQPRQGLRSPRYTTSWEELPEATIAYRVK